MKPTVCEKIWSLLCSLKLTILLASAATLVTMAGSLNVPANPGIFGSMDAMPLGPWFSTFGGRAPALTWWVYLAAGLILLLGLNTLCCFIDWLRRLRARWRKAGEYLIHLGFVVVLVAYAWGSTTGFRSEGNRLEVGQTLAIRSMPGHYLRLKGFEPRFNRAGRPVDMVNQLELLLGETVIAEGTVSTNRPLTYRGLAVIPASFGRIPSGFRVRLNDGRTVKLTKGSRIQLGDGRWLRVHEFFPHAGRLPDGRAVFGSDNLGRPAFELELQHPGGSHWRGWFFLQRPAPAPMVEAGLAIQPLEPLYQSYSVLTINRDPGAFLALTGALIMLTGVVFAMGSFYYKRSRGDRPDIA